MKTITVNDSQGIKIVKEIEKNIKYALTMSNIEAFIAFAPSMTLSLYFKDRSYLKDVFDENMRLIDNIAIKAIKRVIRDLVYNEARICSDIYDDVWETLDVDKLIITRDLYVDVSGYGYLAMSHISRGPMLIEEFDSLVSSNRDSLMVFDEYTPKLFIEQLTKLSNNILNVVELMVSNYPMGFSSDYIVSRNADRYDEFGRFMCNVDFSNFSDYKTRKYNEADVVTLSENVTETYIMYISSILVRSGISARVINEMFNESKFQIVYSEPTSGKFRDTSIDFYFNPKTDSDYSGISCLTMTIGELLNCITYARNSDSPHSNNASATVMTKIGKRLCKCLTETIKYAMGVHKLKIEKGYDAPQ